MRTPVWGVLLLACWLSACGQTSSPAQASDGGSAGSGSGGTTSGSAGAGAGAPNAGSAGEGNLERPSDNRPARPTWNPPLPLGEPGWKGSEEPLCESHQGGTLAFTVWADNRGVYAFFVADCDGLSSKSGCSGTKGSALQFNDGTGWQWLYQAGTSVPSLAGLPNGPVALTGSIAGESGVFFLDEGMPRLSLPLPADASANVFGVNAELAVAKSVRDVLTYRAGEWRDTATLPFEIYDIWADAENVIAVGPDQSIFLRQGEGKFEPLPQVPAGDYTSVWAFGSKDIWAGNSQNQLVHFDGSRWQTIETASHDATGSGIIGMWGDGGVVYFITFTEFGRADELGARLIYERAPSAAPSEPYLTASSLWGRSKDEVFLTFDDAAFKDYRCGSSFIVWYDGAEFHQF
jgi:hypothetical protein